MKQISDKRGEAKTRQEAYSKLSIEEKLKSLDVKFGEGKGAKKVRKRLLKAKEAQKGAKQAQKGAAKCSNQNC